MRPKVSELYVVGLPFRAAQASVNLTHVYHGLLYPPSTYQCAYLPTYNLSTYRLIVT